MHPRDPRELETLLEGHSEIEDGRLELVRLAAHQIIGDALDGEARDALG